MLIIIILGKGNKMKKIYIYIVVILLGTSAIFVNYLNNKSKPDVNEKVIIQNGSDNINKKIENKEKNIKENENKVVEENKKVVEEININQNVNSDEMKQIQADAKKRYAEFTRDRNDYKKGYETTNPNADYYHFGEKK